MGIWSQLLKGALKPLVDEHLNELRKKEVEKGLASQFATANYSSTLGVKDSDKRVFSKSVPFRTLREFSIYYPILRACINYRKRQISQLDWDIAPKEVITDKTKKDKYKKDAKQIRDLFSYPTGDKQVSFQHFLNKIIEDLIVLDASAIYKRRTRGGGMYGYLPIDASTIELVVNLDGTTPQPPESAYVQKINGAEVTQLTTDELIYRMMNPRTYTPYGLSPVESLILTITTALKLSTYNLSYLTEGNVPEGFVELPQEVASSTDQLLLWQEKWDSMFAGNAAFQRKIKFLPQGMKLHETKKPSDMAFEQFDKWLLLNTCSMLEVPPQAIGFQFDRGKGATEAEWEIGKERGLFPLARVLKEMFDQIIEHDFEMEHLQFVWTNINPTNKKEEADVFAILVKTGAVSVDEWRIAEGYDPIGLGQYIMMPTGAVLVDDFISAPTTMPIPGANGQMPPDGPAPKTSVKPDADPKPDQKAKPTPDVKQKVNDLSRGEIIEELKRWKKVATKDFKIGKEFRDFSTNLIDFRSQRIIVEGLKKVKGREDIDLLFDPLINNENQIISAMLDLYDELEGLGKNESNTPDSGTESS